MKNRLDLDWGLSTAKDRTAFLTEYINEDIFEKRPPNEDELETMANYLLWGQDEDGLNPDQRKEIQLPRKNQTWSGKEPESLEALLESPTFLESEVYKLGAVAPKKTRNVFSREELKKKLSPESLEPFETLWEEIDRIEILINFFEIFKGKREKPPRKELLERFSEEEVETFKARAEQLTQFKFLKLKHLLVELRREQYTLKDAVLPQIVSYGEIIAPDEEETFNFEIFPFGEQQDLLFRDFGELLPQNFSEEELKTISSYYWKKKEDEKRIRRESTFYFDFRELEMVYQLLLQQEELRGTTEINQKLLDILQYYVRQADLPPIQEKILVMKIRRNKNQDIANFVNGEFGKSYTANYISTIFRQKIIPAINEVAAYHERIVGSLFFEEDFKTCSGCGRLLLRDPINFVRRSRAKDGLSNHCKKCDKEEREKKKGGIIKDGERY